MRGGMEVLIRELLSAGLCIRHATMWNDRGLQNYSLSLVFDGALQWPKARRNHWILRAARYEQPSTAAAAAFAAGNLGRGVTTISPYTSTSQSYRAGDRI